MINNSQLLAASEFAFETLGPTLRIVALIILLLIVVAALVGLVVVASLPGAVAARRHHPQANAVRVLGWVGLPTGFLWAIAFAWAFWEFGESGVFPGSVGADSSGLESHPTVELRKQVDHLEGLVKQLEQSKGLSS